MTPLSTFPVDALPVCVGEQANAVAEFTRIPADTAVTMALAALSTAASVRVDVQIRDGWTHLDEPLPGRRDAPAS
ncbi:hypothetical protein [Streptomyces sp. TLI_146]|uniref:hypothetical protein n=1 Tax=Streptomyces sp. TLI_146 TaxID=1938858 RepID=UPI000C70BFCB|nr:hypothetical protein [Streptomyces sp. TLI_146]PKV88514.1 hypothetical protein BX283_6134 [Streptomyces sp. TLI_146]